MAVSQKIYNDIPGEALEPLPPYISSSNQSLPVGDIEQPPPEYGNAPPSYNTAASGTASTELLPPDTLLLNGTAIHSGGSVSSPRLYELSHHIARRELTTTVELSRIDYHARGASQTGPEAAGRAKSIFTLTQLPPITTPKFEFYLHSNSRGNIGNVGLEAYSGFRSGSGYRAWRVTRPRVAAEMEAKELLFVARARGAGRYDWRDGADEGRVLAYEAGEGEYSRFQIVEEMDRGRRDALVGAWCLRVWQEIVDSRPTTRYRRHRHGHVVV